VTANLQQVHVRVNDTATGKPTPCQICFKDAEGNYYAPYGRTARFASNLIRWWSRIYMSGTLVRSAYIDGTCEIQLPAGPVHVSIQKGPEYEPIERRIDLPLGKAALRFELQRLFDPRASGWYSGLIVKLPLSPHDMLLEGAAEGVQIVDLLAYERETNRAGHERWHVPTGLPGADGSGADELSASSKVFETMIDYPNLVAFSGQRPCVQNEHCLVAVNTLNSHRVLGDLALLHCHRIVYPLRFGRSAWDPLVHPKQLQPDNWTLAEWCDQCHRKRGLVIGTHVELSAPGFGGETLANLILSKVDAITDWDDASWHLLLQLGLKVPRVAGGISTRPIGGRGRTYVQLEAGEELSYGGWIEAIRKGRTTVSNGPLLTMTVNGRGVGEQIDLPGPGGTVVVHAAALSRDRFDRIEVIHNGTVVHTADAKRDHLYTASTEYDLKVSQSGWLVARCILVRAGDPKPPVEACTSPIYVRADNRPPPPDVEAGRVVLGCLDRVLAWVQNEADCETPRDRERLADVFLEARQRISLAADRRSANLSE
jgi:hypothetical protein